MTLTVATARIPIRWAEAVDGNQGKRRLPVREEVEQPFTQPRAAVDLSSKRAALRLAEAEGAFRQ